MNGNAARKYTYYPHGIDLPLAMRDYSGGGGGTTSLFHLDGQGNVYLLTNTSGTRRSEYRFRAWGDRYNGMTENVASPFTYKAREEDRETGLIYMRHRYYSPRLERFVNEDPIGIAGGLNTFAFTGSDPVNRADPLGLYCWWVDKTAPVPTASCYGYGGGATFGGGPEGAGGGLGGGGWAGGGGGGGGGVPGRGHRDDGAAGGGCRLGWPRCVGATLAGHRSHDGEQRKARVHKGDYRCGHHRWG